MKKRQKFLFNFTTSVVSFNRCNCWRIVSIWHGQTKCKFWAKNNNTMAHDHNEAHNEAHNKAHNEANYNEAHNEAYNEAHNEAHNKANYIEAHNKAHNNKAHARAYNHKQAYNKAHNKAHNDYCEAHLDVYHCKT